MIAAVTYYQAVCDVCGYVDEDGEYSAYSDPDTARMTALDYAWAEILVPSETNAGLDVYTFRSWDGGAPRYERSILLCQKHTGDGVLWCAICEEDLDERGWTLQGLTVLTQTCSEGHVSTISLRSEES